ncbi:MAG: hypothetical protein ABJD11_09900 [Gemmatimonadota bacterium]
MSDFGRMRIRRALSIGAVLVAGLAPMAHAQTTTTFRAQYDSIHPLLVALDDSIARRDSAAQATGPFESLNAGALTILSDAADTARVRAAAPLFWRSIEARFGSSASLLADLQLSVRRMPSNRRHGSDLLVGSADERGNTNTGAAAPYRVLGTEASDSDLASALTEVEATLLLGTLDDSIRSWVGGPIPASARTGVEWENAYLDLLTAPSFVARGCYSGVFEQCRIALQLVPSINPAFDWYDGPQRAALVSRMGFRTGPASSRWTGPYNDCAIHRLQPVCDSLLRRLDPAVIQPPLGTVSRAGLLGLVLEAGAPASFARLVETRGQPIERRLAAGAALSPEELLHRWHASVIAARPHPVEVTPASASAALFWCVLLGALSMRSTRWR